MVKTEFYLGFAKRDKVYYFSREEGKPCCKSGVILEITVDGTSVVFTLLNEDGCNVSVPYEHIFKHENLCFAYATAVAAF